MTPSARTRFDRTGGSAVSRWKSSRGLALQQRKHRRPPPLKARGPSSRAPSPERAPFPGVPAHPVRCWQTRCRRVRLGQCDQVTHRLRRQRRVDDDKAIVPESEIGVKSFTGSYFRSVSSAGPVMCVAALPSSRCNRCPRRARDELGGNATAGAAAIVHDDRLSERGTELLRDEARNRVGTAPRCVRNDEAQRLHGIRLRDRCRAQRRECDGRCKCDPELPHACPSVLQQCRHVRTAKTALFCG